MRSCTEALSKVIDKITKKEILLPDFQRNFVWKEEEKQAKLVASVLAKLPVGSILLLNSDSKEYAYKMIGCKQRKTSEDLGINGDIQALLDGQQRVTVLTNAFSNVVFDMAKTASQLVSPALKRRFFIRIPKYKSEDVSVEDLFNVRGLSLPWKDAEKDEPTFLADEMYEAIKVVNFNAGGNDCFNPFKEQPPKSELITYCSTGKEYLIPLFLLTGNNDAWLTQILQRIAQNIEIDIMDEYDKLDKELRDDFVRKILTKDTQELADNPDRITERAEFEKELEKQGRMWAASLLAYLNSCLNGIQLNQIIVDNHNRARAINIYENLNKGGVPLSTFELVMARFASVSDENYYDKLVDNMKKNRDYSHMVYSQSLKNNDEVKKYINTSYNATLELNCLDQTNDEMVGIYIDAYLDVISLYSHCCNFDTSKLNISLIKRDKILSINPNDLKNKCDEVCLSLDRALFFFQMRCGIRSIKEINYGLMLVVVAYILLNPEYRDDEFTYDVLEAWYWTTVFSGYFNTDQTGRAILSIEKIIHILKTKDTTWIKSLKEQMFKVNYFSEKEFLLLNRVDDAGIYPKEFLRNVVCQFYLVQTYNGIFDKSELISPFTKKKLEKHHVIPLGSLRYPDEKIKASGEKMRNEKDYFLNTPFNFIFITSEENNAISDDTLSSYSSRIADYASRTVLGLNGNFDTSSEEKCKEILRDRFDDFVGKIQHHVDTLIP